MLLLEWTLFHDVGLHASKQVEGDDSLHSPILFRTVASDVMELTAEEKKQVAKRYKQIDIDQSDKIDLAELRLHFPSLRENNFSLFDKDGDGEVRGPAAVASYPTAATPCCCWVLSSSL